MGVAAHPLDAIQRPSFDSGKWLYQVGYTHILAPPENKHKTKDRATGERLTGYWQIPYHEF